MKKENEILKAAVELLSYYNSPGMNAEKLEQKIERLARDAEKILASETAAPPVEKEEIRETLF